MIKVGVFGVGHLGRIHIQQWLIIPGVEIVGFYDPDDNNASITISSFNIKRFNSPEELIQQSDAIDIVTTTTSHFEVAQACLKQFKHLFIEKPMTHTLEEAKELVKLVNESQVVCQIGHVERYNPAVLALKDKHISPMFVEAHRLAQFNPRGTDVNVVLDLMIHDIDVLLHFVNSPVRKISANGVAVISETVDIANAHLEFDNGCVANLTASRISLKKMRKMRLFQKDAYIGIDFLKKDSEIIRIKDSKEEKSFFDFPIEMKNGQQKIFSIEKPKSPDINAIREELSAFILSIIQKTTPPVTVYDGLHAIDVAYQIIQKMDRQAITMGV